MNSAVPSVVDAVVDHQLIPRSALGVGTASYVLEAVGDASVAVRVTDSRGAVHASPHVVDKAGRTHVAVDLATGGPYRIEVSVEGAEGAEGPVLVHCAEGVLVGDLWILAGQSNMSGGGIPDGGPQPVLDRAVMLSLDGAWKPAVDPLHRVYESPDNILIRLVPDVDPTRTADDVAAMYNELEGLGRTAFSGGIGCGTFFAEELALHADVPVGLLPCALGASPLDMWRRGWASPRGVDGSLYEYMVTQAARFGPATGVLWYQGESDTAPELAATYRQRFEEFVDEVRADLALPDLPFITVQLASVSTWPDVLEAEWARVRDAQRRAAAELHNVEVVAAAGLALVDGLHLDTPGHRELGRRLARAATRYVEGARQVFATPRLARVEADGNDLICRVEGVNGALRAPEDAQRLFRSDAEITRVLVIEPDVVVVSTAAPATWIGYCLRYGDHAEIVDEAGLPLPAFGPVAVAASARPAAS